MTKVYQKSIDNLEERIRKADHIIKNLDQLVVSKVAANAFVISADGIKVLPEDWRERLSEK